MNINDRVGNVPLTEVRGFERRVGNFDRTGFVAGRNGVVKVRVATLGRKDCGQIDLDCIAMRLFLNTTNKRSNR